MCVNVCSLHMRPCFVSSFGLSWLALLSYWWYPVHITGVCAGRGAYLYFNSFSCIENEPS